MWYNKSTKEREGKKMITNETKARIIELADALIDDRIDLYGINNTIAYLVNFGFTDEELIEMGFDADDVGNVRASLKVE